MYRAQLESIYWQLEHTNTHTHHIHICTQQFITSDRDEQEKEEEKKDSRAGADFVAALQYDDATEHVIEYG